MFGPLNNWAASGNLDVGDFANRLIAGLPDSHGQGAVSVEAMPLEMTMKPEILDFCKNFLGARLHCNYRASNLLVLMSRVNEHLCYEAERGRVHGGGCIVNQRWILSGGDTQLVLHHGEQGTTSKDIGYPFDSYSGGEPLIEVHWNATKESCILPMNGGACWNTPFPYLRASVYPQPFGRQRDDLGFYLAEYQQAVTLGEKWGLTDRWGDTNRLAEGNWHEDDSLLTTKGDSAGLHYLIFGANGIPQYAVELLSTPDGVLILPYRYLKREGFCGPRRVFFPPEKDIAVWGAHRIASPAVENVVLTNNPCILLGTRNLPMTFSVGCLLGGASSVAKSDLAVLRGKNCILPLFDTSDLQSQLDFVMKVAARLRKMYITPQFVQIPSPYSRIFDAPQDGQPFEEPEVTELSLSALCALANRCQIFVPEELRSDYLGDITSLIESKSPDSVIPELFQLGDVLAAEVREDELMPMLTAHLARCFQNGNDVFPKLWRVERAFHTTVFVDGVQDKTAQALRGTGVRVCDVRFASAPENERLEMFRGVIAPTQIVLFASFELWEHAEAFLEVLRWCRQNEVAAILLTPEKGGANREESGTW